MICPKCATENPALAKFCVSCGEKLEPAVNKLMDDEEKTIEQEERQEEDDDVPQQQVASEPNEFVEKTKEISKNYWEFLLQALKAPYQTTLHVGVKQSDMINGLITLILFSLFIPLSFYTTAVRIAWRKPPFFDTVVLPFIMFIIFIAIMIGIMFAVARFMKSDIDFMQVYTRFMTFMMIPAVLSLLALIFNLLKANTFTGILTGLVFLMVSLSTIGTLFTIKETKEKSGGLDVIYVILIFIMIIMLILLLLGDALLGQMINDFNPMDQLDLFF